MTYTLIKNWPDLDTWIAELKSGKWHQMSGYLEGDRAKAEGAACKIEPGVDKAYCCLGVGCVLARGSVPPADDQTVELWNRDFDDWVEAGEPSEDELADDPSYLMPANDIYVPADHYLGTPVTLASKTEGMPFTLVNLVVDANDMAWDGKFTQVINVLEIFRDGVRDFAFDPINLVYRMVTE